MKFLAPPIFLLCASLAFGSDNVPAPAQTQTVALVGATLHPVSGPEIPNGTLIFEKGAITALGAGLPVPEGARVVDLKGRHVYPGLISAHTVLGLTELESVRATQDSQEAGDVNPNVRAQPAINPDSELLPVARSNGVLTALSVPKTQDGLISGISTVIHLDGWTWESMTVKASVGLHVFWPELRIDHNPRYPKSPEDQQKEIDARLRQLRETFAQARAYAKGAAGQTTNVKLAAMAPALRGEMPVFVHVDEIKGIQSAVAWAAQEGIKLVIVGGLDAWRVPDLLKRNDVPVIVSAVNTLPLRRDDPYDAAYANAGKLQTAGVRFCIANEGTDFDAAHDRNLPYQAAQAAAYGLPKDEALKAVTLYPARILGVADRLGSLEVGKEATLFVTDGDPLEITTHVEAAYIAGRPVDLSNKQTRLYDKYRQKYGQ